MRCRSVVALSLLAIAATACGPDRETALEVESARRLTDRSIRLETECAERMRVEVQQPPGGLVEITMWGHPRPGRCRTRQVIPLIRPPGGDVFIDGATSRSPVITPR